MNPLTVRENRDTTVQELAAPEPWKAWLLPLTALPMPEEGLEAYRGAMLEFTEQLTLQAKLNAALALQIWKLSSKLGGDVLQQRMDEWPFDLGFGVWPNRPAPTGWNEDSIQDAAAAVYRGDEPSMPSHRMLLFKMQGREAYRAALQQMSGFGAAVHLFAREPIENLRQQSRKEFLPRVLDSRFRGGRVYLPVLDSESLRSASDGAELDRWLCGADVYVRESAEDRGLLVISRLPDDLLTMPLELLAGKLI